MKTVDQGPPDRFGGPFALAGWSDLQCSANAKGRIGYDQSGGENSHPARDEA